MTEHWWPIGLILLSTTSATAETPTTAPQSGKEFDIYKKRGDDARAAGHLAEAASAYAEALALHDDPTIAGRAGLVLFELGENDAAAYQLLRAIEDASAGSSQSERAQFFKTYEAARRKVCRADVVLNRKGALVEIDGEVRQHGPADFWIFVGAGKHTIRAHLDGFDDAIEEFTANPGGRISLSLFLQPTQTKNMASTIHQDQPVVRKQLYEDKPPTNPVKSSSKGQFIFGGGVVVVVGATPNAAIGPQMFAAWRSMSWWEIGLDFRAAWALGSLEGFPDARVMTWSAGLTPCARLRNRFFGCALAQFDGFVPGSAPATSAFMFGGGARVGIEFHPDKHIGLQVWGEGVLHPRGFRSLAVGRSGWYGPSIFGAIGARAIIFF